MRKLLLLICIFTVASSGLAMDYLISSSNLQKLTKEELTDKSNSFLRYARNEIFARHGYKFDDLDLKLYFSKQVWYMPSAEGSVTLTPLEKYNVELIHSVEAARTEDLYEVLFKTDYNDGAIYYIAYNAMPGRDGISKWRNGKLAYVDSSYAWVLKCFSIPPEYLMVVSAANTRLSGPYGAILPDQKSIIDFDEGYDNNLGKEIYVDIVEASDDSKYILYGLNNDLKFVELFHLDGGILRKSRINSHMMLITSNIRMDLCGNSFFEQQYLYDTNTKELYTVPNLIIAAKKPFNVKTKVSLNVYYDARSAALRKPAAIIDAIPAGIDFSILSFYRAESKGSAEVKYSLKGIEKTGWIPQVDINPRNINGLPAAD